MKQLIYSYDEDNAVLIYIWFLYLNAVRLHRKQYIIKL